MRVGSLFSGIGGIELGLERAGGFETIWFVEKEKYAQSILRRHWPEAEIYEDVTKIDFRSVPRVDIVIGGFPCQDISNAGKRAGIEGSRSSLWAYCVEALRILRPRIGLFENVSALTQRGLDKVLLDLSEVGYDAEWYCFPASSVGANHRRDRIIIMAYPNDSRCLDGQTQEQSAERRQYEQRELISSSENVANSSCRRLEESRESRRPLCETKNTTEKKCRFEYDGFWSVEPRVGRVANGVPHRSHRIKALGNAVVPAWAEAIGKAIKEQIMER